MIASDNRQGERRAVQTYARAAGLLLLVSIVAGGFGEGYAPGLLIHGDDAGATLAALKAQEPLFRLSFAAYLVEAACDITIALIFYILLSPVSRALALLAAFFGVISTATYAFCELFYFALPHLLTSDAGYLATFTPDQIAALTLLSMNLFSYGAGLFLVFYGLGWIVRGWLMVRSLYLPSWLGVLMIVGGLGFVARTLTGVLAPHYASPIMLFLMAPGGVLLGLWLLVGGVNQAKWDASLARP
jgi:hypothetical protein